LITLLISALLLAAPHAPRTPPQRSRDVVAQAQGLIRQQHYDSAISRLEQYLETAPDDPEALTYLAAAQLYSDHDYLKAEESFERAFRAGGGASFFVTHSHETMLSGEDITSYCRGWLHLRRGGLEFVPDEGDHGFRMTYAEVAEIKQNRHKTFFHVKRAGGNQNFRPRSDDERETLLILALYKKFSR
jgi:tetratricopeptide (TPR) repeat protein